VAFYPYVGVGEAKFKRTSQDESFTSYHMGSGSACADPKFSLDLRGELQAAVDGDVSRKLVNISLGGPTRCSACLERGPDHEEASQRSALVALAALAAAGCFSSPGVRGGLRAGIRFTFQQRGTFAGMDVD